MGCYFHFCPRQEARPSLTDDDIKRGTSNNVDVKNHVRTHFAFKRSLSTNSLVQIIRNEKMFGYVQCDLSVPDELKAKFSNFPTIFKNIDVFRNDIGEYMKTYAEENDLLKQSQRMLISSFKLTNGTLITPLFNFYLDLGLQCTKIHRFVQYTPHKVFNSFVQSVVDARRAGDEHPLFGVVAETMKLLGNSSYGYQIMDRSKHTMTKYLGDEKTHKAINNQFFMRLNIVAKDLYEVELVKSTIEHREPIIVGFFILQYAKLRMLELYYNFFDEFCDVNKFEELEMDTDFLKWTERRSKDCRDDFRADAKTTFSPVLAVLNIRNMTRENQDCSKRSSDAPKCYACVVKPFAVTIVKVKSISLAVKV